MTGRPCQCALAVFHKNVANPSQNVENVIKRTLQHCSVLWNGRAIWNGRRLSGCGTQHPHRALGGTRVLLAAAPTTPPCFRHWRRSLLLHFGHNQRKYCLYFAFVATCGSLQTHFHGRGRRGERHLPQKSENGFNLKSEDSRHTKRGCCAVQQPLRVTLWRLRPQSWGRPSACGCWT